MQIRHAFGVYFGAVCHDIRPFQQNRVRTPMPHPTSNTGHGFRTYRRPANRIFAGNIEIDQKMLAQRFLRSYFTHSFRLNIFPGVSIPDSSGTEPIFSVSADGDRFAPTVRHLPERTPSSAAYRKRRTLLRTPSGAGRAPVRFRSDHRNGPKPHPSAGIFSFTGPALAQRHPSALIYRPQKASDWPFGRHNHQRYFFTSSTCLRGFL